MRNPSALSRTLEKFTHSDFDLPILLSLEQQVPPCPAASSVPLPCRKRGRTANGPSQGGTHPDACDSQAHDKTRRIQTFFQNLKPSVLLASFIIHLTCQNCKILFTSRRNSPTWLSAKKEVRGVNFFTPRTGVSCFSATAVVAAAAAAVIAAAIAAPAVPATAAAAKDDDQNDDPQTAAASKTVIAAPHMSTSCFMKVLRGLFALLIPIICTG